jgi:Cysteine-rich secretory protein family/PKD domain
MRFALTLLLLLTAGLTVRGSHPSELASSTLERPRVSDQRTTEGVQYRVTPSNGSAPLNVTFEITGGNAETFAWDFGDGTRSVGARVEHTYFRPGQYTARLETEANGELTRGEIPIRAGAAGPERAQMTVLFETGTFATLDARRSLIYRPLSRATWIFADGSRQEGLKIEHEFKPGLQAVRLEVQGTNAKLSQVLAINPGVVAGNPDFDRQVLDLTNQARARKWDCVSKRFPVLNPSGQVSSGPSKIRLAALERNIVLDRAARAQSAGMALSRYFDHQSSLDSSHPADRVSASDYPWQMVGENIAAGQPTPAIVVDAWLRSPGHCKNIMNPNFTQIGLSFVQRPSSGSEPQARNFWTQVFARPDSNQ